MTIFFESIILAITALYANLMRSILTTIGIIVGVTSIIAVISIMQGFTYKLTQNFENMGSNVFIIQPSASFKDQLRGNFGKLTLADLRAIERVIEDENTIIPSYHIGGVSVEYKGNISKVMNFWGTTSGYSDVNSYYVEEGRFIIPSDDLYNRKVVVLGSEVREELELSDDYLGEYVKIFNQWYKVIGEMEERGSIFGIPQDNTAFIPFETVGLMVENTGYRQLFISIQVNDLTSVPSMIGRLETLLRKRHNIGPDDSDDFKIQSAEKIKSQQEDTLLTFTYIVSAIVGISLLVGGIGIMNIMLVSVTERTKEIGICKALGAKRLDILIQFLAEAVILCLLGGIIGVIMGYLIGLFIANLVPGIDHIIVPMWAIGLSLGFSSFIGIVFGIIPASKAATMDPIQVLHYE